MLTDFQLDALREVINIGIGQAASSLNLMLHQHIKLNVPILHLVSPSSSTHLDDTSLQGQVTSISQSFDSPLLSGTAALLFPVDSATHLVKALTGDDSDSFDVDQMFEGVLMEVGNIMISGLFGSISSVFSSGRYDFSIPSYQVLDVGDVMEGIEIAGSPAEGVLAEVSFDVEQLSITGFIVMLFKAGSLERFAQALNDTFGQGV